MRWVLVRPAPTPLSAVGARVSLGPGDCYVSIPDHQARLIPVRVGSGPEQLCHPELS